VAPDSELVGQLMDETGGDGDAAARFAEESAGRTTSARQLESDQAPPD
jgi:hypothetical protein